MLFVVPSNFFYPFNLIKNLRRPTWDWKFIVKHFKNYCIFIPLYACLRLDQQAKQGNKYFSHLIFQINVCSTFNQLAQQYVSKIDHLNYQTEFDTDLLIVNSWCCFLSLLLMSPIILHILTSP